METMSQMSIDELREAQAFGAATFFRAYVHLMARALDVDETDADQINTMVSHMIEPTNHATEAIWRSMMDDTNGAQEAVKRFQESLEEIQAT